MSQSASRIGYHTVDINIAYDSWILSFDRVEEFNAKADLTPILPIRYLFGRPSNRLLSERGGGLQSSVLMCVM